MEKIPEYPPTAARNRCYWKPFAYSVTYGIARHELTGERGPCGFVIIFCGACLRAKGESDAFA